MFVRFRAGRRRLALSLVETKRLNGNVRHEHVATLGSVETPLSIRSRIAFWAKLSGRLEALGNRVDAEVQAKIMGQIHARVPMVTPDEQRVIQVENAKGDERFWDSLQGANASSADGHKQLIRPPASRRRIAGGRGKILTG